jgi:hypothetical protein
MKTVGLYLGKPEKARELGAMMRDKMTNELQIVSYPIFLHFVIVSTSNQPGVFICYDREDMSVRYLRKKHWSYHYGLLT